MLMIFANLFRFTCKSNFSNYFYTFWNYNMWIFLKLGKSFFVKTWNNFINSTSRSTNVLSISNLLPIFGNIKILTSPS